MNPIKLVDYAEHSLKVPEEFLAPQAKKDDVKLWKIFVGHYLDFSAAVVTTTMIVSFFNLSLKSFMITKSLQKLWSDEVVGSFTIAALPSMVFCYFFFSYFFNHGQTWGMHLMKARVSMKDKSFKEAALWACSSMVLCFTCGLSYYIMKSKWQHFKSNDYLYDNLMVERTLSPVQLVSAIEEYDRLEKEEKEQEEQNWAKAA